METATDAGRSDYKTSISQANKESVKKHTNERTTLITVCQTQVPSSCAAQAAVE